MRKKAGNQYIKNRQSPLWVQQRKPGRHIAFVLALLAVFSLWAGILSVPAQAASGTVYTCKINPCYRHPVTGVIEDSGGESSYTTGQGMVEGAVNATGILEVTDSGEYYLTIRMSLMDYASNHSFWVQTSGDTDWQSPQIGVTGEGSDSNGTTNDICMQVPSKDCVVRGSMYVEPMGRDVVFYLYPSDFKEGNSTDMNATLVTESSNGSASLDGVSDGQQSSQVSATDNTAADADASDVGSTSSGASVSGGSTGTDSTAAVSAETGETAQSEDETALNKAQGLSLSTADEAAVAANQTAQSGGALGVGQQILVNIVSITVSGLILIAAAAFVVYLFRKNWYRWFGDNNDDYEDDYDDED